MLAAGHGLTDPGRAAALSEQLSAVHQGLRDALATLRSEAATGGSGAPGDGAIPADLLSHCLSFCAAIGAHHGGEDGGLLPELRAAAPELAPLIDKLAEDHRLVDGIVRRLRELAAGRGRRPGRDPDVLVRELDGLTAILESHFGFEERRIGRALDSLTAGDWAGDVFRPAGLAD